VQEMARRYGEDFDWWKEPNDLVVMHTSGGGKVYGW
jgi:hypothetical protein